MSRTILRPLSTMTYYTGAVSPFTSAVVTSMQRLYPESLADRSWDNTGLLLEAPSGARRRRNSVLLTVDLTTAVTDEAIAQGASIVVAYHPIIFRGLKALRLADTQQRSLLRLAAAGVSVYSPHTAVDNVPGGLGDWLADIVTGHAVAAATPAAAPARPAPTRTYSSPSYPRAAEAAARPVEGALDHRRGVIQPVSKADVPPGFDGAGTGRWVQFEARQPLGVLVDRIAKGVGSPKGFAVAVPQGRRVDEIEVLRVAVCAGSGGSVFRGVEADLYFTGELSHHEALAITEKGGCVVSLFHSNTERGYLHQIMRERLESEVRTEWETVRRSEEYKDEEWAEVLADESVEVVVSKVDRDPYGIVVLQDD